MKAKFTKKKIEELNPLQKAYEAVDEQFPGFIIRIQPTGRKTFYYSYRANNGKRVRLKLGRYGDITLAQAKAMATATAGDIAKGLNPQGEKQNTKAKLAKDKALTLGIYIEQYYEEYVLTHNKSGPESLDIIGRNFKFLMNTPLKSIDAATIEGWQVSEMTREYRTGKVVKPSTINRNMTCLRAVFKRAMDTQHIQINPLSKIKNLKEMDEEIIRYLSPDEEASLYQGLRNRHNKMVSARLNANKWRTSRNYDEYSEYKSDGFVDHLEPMVLLAINTGLRRGEIFKLKWQDVDFERKVVTVRAANAKSRKVRHVNLNKKVIAILSTWKSQQASASGWVFKNANGNKFTDIKKAWVSVLETQGIKDFRFHDLRHHFASKLVMLGVPLNTIRELLGHASLSTTIRYAHLGQDHKADAVERLAD